ncbi:MAG TPA: 2-oxo-4-hydroxy-4-carboxy-5-ureidoimidazoline decarboxylase [Candidatus Limnocylindrales bacterium]|nr:2-oxo-4-hydroxy-4-carboxy-5-ureidoimidazoline decarboxylase [Candidatus Limnocylindrales bacterium]
MRSTTTPNLLAALFEGAPRFVARLAQADGEPIEAVLERADDIAQSMPEEEQVELLNAHPRIGALPSTVSAMSYKEQGYDRDPGTVGLQERLDHLNEEYERRFGFRFVVFVAGRPRSAIADVMESRMSASRDEELARGLSDVVAIARDRLGKVTRVEEGSTA